MNRTLPKTPKVKAGARQGDRIMSKTMVLGIIIFGMCINCVQQPVHAEGERRRRSDMEAKRIVSQYKTVFNKPPTKTPSRTAVDGPLLGNGSIAATISGPPEAQRFWLCKNDFWRFKSRDGEGYVTGVGYMDISIPGLKGAKYHLEQNLYNAKTSAVFSKENATVTMHSYVAAEHNLLIVEIESKGEALSGEIAITPLKGGNSDSLSGKENATAWIVRKFEKGVDVPSAVAAAVKLYGADGTEFELKPGKSVRLAIGMRSLLDGPDYLTDARQLVASVDFDDVETAHCKWWHDFWSKSWVEIGDPLVEQRYYLSNYVMGSCCRDLEFPPGIFGSWVTVDHPEWHGDYHLNYNYQAPFYGLYSGNHIEQANTYHAPILAFIERGKFYAKAELNCRGVYFPIGLGPKGLEVTRHSTYFGNTGPGLFHQQKSNAAYCLVNIALHWYSTYDPEYGKDVYPLVIEVVNFWEDYLTWEKDSQRYVIYKDAIHEWSGNDMNPIMSLGMVRNAFYLALDMSKELRVDAERHNKWNHILGHMSAFPTQEKNGKTVFRYSEKGMAWSEDNTLGIQHIYPAGAIGLESDPKLLEISRNTIEVMGRWLDGNGMNSFYPAAARVGYDPEVILSQLRSMIKRVGSPNGFTVGNPHGIENCSIVPNTINMMLCMAHQNVLRIFPVWPKNKDARFSDLRMWGAFLVSGELKDGQVQYVRIRSERGKPCIVQNPWPGDKVAVFRDGVKAETVSGDRFTLATRVNEEIRLVPMSPEK